MREWAQVAEAILINLQIASAPAEAIETLRKPLLDAVNKAIARRREKRAQKEEEANTDTTVYDGGKAPQTLREFSHLAGFGAAAPS